MNVFVVRAFNFLLAEALFSANCLENVRGSYFYLSFFFFFTETVFYEGIPLLLNFSHTHAHTIHSSERLTSKGGKRQ